MGVKTDRKFTIPGIEIKNRYTDLRKKIKKYRLHNRLKRRSIRKRLPVINKTGLKNTNGISIIPVELFPVEDEEDLPERCNLLSESYNSNSEFVIQFCCSKYINNND